MGILIDTDVLIEYLRGNEAVVRKLTDLYNNGEKLCYSPVTRTEIIAGLRKGEEEITSSLFSLMECFDIGEETGHKAGEYMKKFRSSHTVEIADALIAATVHDQDVSLWTFNKKHYPMKDIEFYG